MVSGCRAPCIELPLNLSNLEEEVVFLKAINELVDSMVNFELMTVLGNDPETNVQFNTTIHQRFFNIALVDFLSKTGDATMRQDSYLGALCDISAHPGFEVNESVAGLRTATCKFHDWLNEKITVDVWLPAIDTQTPIQISRQQFLTMCGNISKHNILRLGRVAKQLRQTLAASGAPVQLDDAMLALGNFYERFHVDILNYHSSTIAEFLNNIRWGIYEYLQPEFRRSIVWDQNNPSAYRFTYPIGITHKFAKQCYWDLMNEVRTEPYVRRFEVTKWMKLRY